MSPGVAPGLLVLLLIDRIEKVEDVFQGAVSNAFGNHIVAKVAPVDEGIARYRAAHNPNLVFKQPATPSQS
jgi:hypothetical protein